MRIIENGDVEGGPPNGFAHDLPVGGGNLDSLSPWFQQYQSLGEGQLAKTLRKDFASSNVVVDSFIEQLFEDFPVAGFYRLDIPDAPEDDLPEWIALISSMGTILVREPDEWTPHNDLFSLDPILCDLLRIVGRLAFTRDEFDGHNILPDQGFYRPPDTLTENSMAYTAHQESLLLGSAFFYRTPCNNYFGTVKDGRIVKWTFDGGTADVAFNCMEQFLSGLTEFWNSKSVSRENHFYY